MSYVTSQQMGSINRKRRLQNGPVLLRKTFSRWSRSRTRSTRAYPHLGQQLLQSLYLQA